MKRCMPFTLVELLAVIALIGVLAGIAVGVSGLVMSKAATSKTEAAVKMLELAINQFHQKYGCYPEVKKGTVSSLQLDVPTTIKGSIWEFLDEKFKKNNTLEEGGHRYAVDAWDTPLFYRVPGYHNKGSFDLGSAGPDKKFGDGQGSELKLGTEFSDDDDTNLKNHAGKGDDIVNFIRKK